MVEVDEQGLRVKVFDELDHLLLVFQVPILPSFTVLQLLYVMIAQLDFQWGGKRALSTYFKSKRS